ncbi:MAG: hypothetical protein AB1757_17360 [Acidobacteriota bacterium]
MWKKLYEVLSRLFALTQKVDKHEKELEAIRQELKTLTVAVQRLAFELQRLNERETAEREKIELRLENQLLKFERRLSSTSPPPIDKEMD